MNKVKRIDLVHENCEVSCFDIGDVNFLEMGPIVDSFTVSGGIRYNNSSYSGFVLALKGSADVSRLSQYMDVTGLYLEYEDGSTEGVGIVWEGSEYSHKGQVLHSTCGGGWCFVSKGGTYNPDISYILEGV